MMKKMRNLNVSKMASGYGLAAKGLVLTGLVVTGLVISLLFGAPAEAMGEVFVSFGSSTPVVTPVAIGTASELSDAVENGGRYYLTGDINLGSTGLSQINNELEIDLRGHNITRITGGQIFKNASTFVIKDTSEGAKGYIGFRDGSVSYDGADYIFQNTSVGTCIISDCELKYMKNSKKAPICNSGNMTLSEVDISYIVNTYSSSTFTSKGVIFNDGTLTVNGGSITNCTSTNVGAAVYTYNTGSLTLDKGVEINNCTAMLTSDGQLIYSAVSSPINIKNARITSNDTDDAYDIYIGSKSENALISGGIIKATFNDRVKTTGGKFTQQPNTGYQVPAGYSVTNLVDDPDGCSYAVGITSMDISDATVQGTISDVLGFIIKADIEVPYGQAIPKVRATNKKTGAVRVLTGTKGADGKYMYELDNIYVIGMADEYSFEFVREDEGEYKKISLAPLPDMSVLSYYGSLYSEYSSDATLVSLLANTVNYAAELQSYARAAYGAEDFTDIDLAGYSWVGSAVSGNMNNAKALSEVRTFADPAKKENRIAGASLTIADRISLQFAVTTAEDCVLKLFDYYGNEVGSAEVGAGAKNAVVKFGGCKIGPDEYDEVFTAKLYKAASPGLAVCEVRYSVGTYCNNMAADGDVRGLVKAIYNFGCAFGVYRAAH